MNSLQRNYPLSHLTWLGVGGRAELFLKAQDLEHLSQFLRENKAYLPITVLGAGSNVIIRDNGIDGVVIKLGKGFTNVTFDPSGNLIVGTACPNNYLAKFVQHHGIGGLEFLVGIPGTIGGGIAMNAGAYGQEFKDIIISVKAIDFRGNACEFNLEEIGFRYRQNSLPKDLIYTEAKIKTVSGIREVILDKMTEISRIRDSTQPTKAKTAGSIFTNPKCCKAWQLIDKVGLRGTRIGDAGISEQHCNFIINHGNATAREIEELGEFVRCKVLDVTGIELSWEIKILGS